MSNQATTFQSIGTVVANGRACDLQVNAPVPPAKKAELLKAFNENAQKRGNLRPLTSQRLGQAVDLTSDPSWEPYTSVAKRTLMQGTQPNDARRASSDSTGTPPGRSPSKRSTNNSQLASEPNLPRSSKAPSHANGANIPSLLGNAAQGDNLPIRPSHVNPPSSGAQMAPRRSAFSRQPSSLQAKISGALDVAATLLQQKVEGAWVDQTKRKGLISNALFQPLQAADSWGIGTAVVVNILPGALLALGGGVGRIVANVIAAAARIGVFAIVAVAGYLLELCIGAIVLGLALAWWSLEALAVVCLGSLDAGVALAMVVLAFITRLFLLDILTNKKIEAEHLISFAGWCHRFFMKCIREIPDVERFLGQPAPVRGLMPHDAEEQEFGEPQPLDQSGALPTHIGSGFDEQSEAPMSSSPRGEREEGKRKQGLPAPAQPDPNGPELEDL